MTGPTSPVAEHVATRLPSGRLAAPSRRILVVCLGNHCRSPFAAAVLTHLGGPTPRVQSAGLHPKWVGKPAHPAMIAAANNLGYDLTEHRGTLVNDDLMRWADVILGMDRSNLTALHRLADAITRPKLALYLGDQDVPDPWGKPDEVFATCARIIHDGAPRHLDHAIR